MRPSIARIGSKSLERSLDSATERIRRSHFLFLCWQQTRVLRNEDSLESSGIELGFRTDKITGHGHVVVMHTVLPMRDYYPGGEVRGFSERVQKNSFTLDFYEEDKMKKS